MKKKVVYLTQWVAKDQNKIYPHGYGFQSPIVDFPLNKDPAWVAQVCRENLSTDEFECYGVVPYPLMDGMFEIMGEQPDLTEVNEEPASEGLTKEALSIEIWNMLPDECKKIMLSLKESYLDSIMADIESYVATQRPNIFPPPNPTTSPTNQ